MLRAALSLALLAACSTPAPPSATGDAPGSKATSAASPSEPAPSALAQDAPLPPVSAAAVSSAPTTPASSAAADPGERIPCKSVRDCWVSSTPARHPIARPARFKKRDFKPCVDGEAEPACGDDGFCTIGRVAAC
ncbi:MAG TPA: hypothetical protein VFS00_22565 [Polyangiaceae bacterium]|nr:hypothetical protein [Polyangiaceae bacterium]